MNTKYVNVIYNDPQLSINCLTSDSLDTLVPYTHIHDEIEIVYVQRGSLSLNIDNTVHILEKDSIAIINRLTPHEFSDNKFSRFILLQFKPTMIYENNKSIDIKYLKPFFHTQEFNCFIASCDSKPLKDIINVLSEIEEKIREKGIAYDLVVQNNLVRLLYLMYLSELFSNKIIESVKQKHDLQQLATLLEYIDSHYDEVITLDQACTIAKLDYHYFSRIFKEKTGKTFVEYLAFIRILNAQKLLCETDFPVSSVAESVGIPNISYFNRMFKKQNGVTPIQYRNCKGILSK